MNAIIQETNSLPLDEKYRPRRPQDLIGQPEAIRLFKEHVSNEKAPAFLLHGPPGVGKTSWAEMFALARNCESPDEKPCMTCKNCRGGLNRLYFYDFSAARWDGAEVTKHVESLMGITPWGNFGIFIDEVHGLQAKAADVILKEVERPRAGRYFICATTELETVRPALKSRCIIVPFHAVPPAELFRLAQGICGEERITFEPAALDILVGLARGSARELVKGLEAVSRLGHLTRDVLKQALSLDWTEHLLAYSEALLAGDLAAQLETMKTWLAKPGDKARHLREFLLYLFNFEVCTPRIRDHVNAAFHLVNAPERSKIVSAMNARARADGFSSADYWSQLLDFWLIDPALMADDAALTIKLHQFHRLLTPRNGLIPATTNVEEAPARKREFRSRSKKGTSSRKNPDQPKGMYLAQKHVERLYEPATFLGQHHGRLFNVSADMLVKAAPEKLEDAASLAITGLTHELGLRIQAYAGRKGDSSYHWLYRNQRSGNVMHCRLALHVPYEHMEAAEQWLADKVWKIDGADEVTVSAVWHNPQPRNTKVRDKSRVGFHWKRMRELWDGLDPDHKHWATDGTRKPLRELLRLKPRAARSEPMSIKMVGFSHSLGYAQRKAAAKNKMSFLSAFKDTAWEHINTGWELLEHRDRLSTTAEREDQVQRVELIGKDPSPLARKRHSEEIQALLRQWPDDARDRPRTWTPWWSAADLKS